jgi:hypothetical protein
MAISQHLQRKLQETLGSDAAKDLVTVVDSIDPIRTEIRELRHETQLGFARMEARLDATLRDHSRFFFLAWAVLLAAIVGLYAK